VLLRPGSCFHVDDRSERAYTAADRNEWGRLGRKPPMLRLGSSRGNRDGYLLGPMSGFDHEDGWCEMPSLAIRPRRLRYGIFPAHPFKPGFSREGDSGDWVVGGEADRTWMGMIVQGSSSLSVAHQAPALIEYFERELRDRQSEDGSLVHEFSYGAS
jgi:hypothetical protein